VLLAINWIWEGAGIHVGLFGYAVLTVVMGVLTLWLMNRQALRKGPPEHRPVPEALPRVSFACAGIGLSTGAILYGAVFGKFLVFIGGALLVFSLGRLALELIWQARSMNDVRRRQGER
jgi:Na+/H+-translocating membrane pyrophosphatase